MPITGRTVVIVDDGLATGGTAHVAVQVARAQGARRIILAVPVAPPETVTRLQSVADQVVSLISPSRFVAVGQWYDDFAQTSDDEVAALLRRGAGAGGPGGTPWQRVDREVVISPDGIELEGRLDVPAGAKGIVLFAHGSGSSRHSPRNQSMARAFHATGLATLLFDLLTLEESADRQRVFDIELLGSRLLAVTAWIRRQPDAAALPCGQPLRPETTLVQWCHGAGVPTSPVRNSRPFDARPCSSSVVPMMRSSSSTARLPAASVATTV